MNRSAPPAWLDPVLSVVERVDRRLRRVRPMSTDGILALEMRRHHGHDVTLRDGTLVASGDRIGLVHFRNDRVSVLADRTWHTRGLQAAASDMRRLARWLEGLPDERRPVAFRGVTLLAPLARRVGFEEHWRPRTGVLPAIHRWYQNGLLARWSPEGRARLLRGRPGSPAEVWISAPEVTRRFGADAQ